MFIIVDSRYARRHNLDMASTHLLIENADRTRVMTDETYIACASYLERLGAAEYRAFLAGRKRKAERYAPTPYHAALVRFLGARDESGFKALKALEGYSSALGF